MHKIDGEMGHGIKQQQRGFEHKLHAFELARAPTAQTFPSNLAIENNHPLARSNFFGILIPSEPVETI